MVLWGSRSGPCQCPRYGNLLESACRTCFPEQIAGIPVPQLMEAVVEVTPTHEQTWGVPVSQIMEAPVDVMLTTPQERVQNRTPELVVDVSVPQIVEESVQHRTQERIADSPVPQIMVAVLPSIPQELVQIRTQEQIVVSSVPQLLEECVQDRTPEQIVDFPVPQTMDAPLHHRSVCKIVRQNRLWGLPVPQIVEDVRAESYARADCGFSCASVHGGSR